MFIFLIGSIVGSFLNVCIWRLPKGESIARPRSYCPNCRKGILWHDNIPIASYLLLGGRCRFCRSRISLRYFLVELLTAALFLALFMTFGLRAKFFAYSVLVSGLIIATFVDFEIQEIPDEITILWLIIGLGLSLAYPSILNKDSRWAGFLDSSIGGLAGAASIYIIGFVWELMRKKEAMGGGDVKLLAMIGVYLGWKLTILTFFIAPLFGLVPGLVLMIKDKRQMIPYGPYLSMGALVSILWGDRILKFLFYGFY